MEVEKQSLEEVIEKIGINKKPKEIKTPVEEFLNYDNIKMLMLYDRIDHIPKITLRKCRFEEYYTSRGWNIMTGSYWVALCKYAYLGLRKPFLRRQFNFFKSEAEAKNEG